MKDRRLFLVATAAFLLVVQACAGHAYLPGEPGGAKSDISGLDVREAWLEANPDTPSAIAVGIREGVFVPGMSLEQRDVITNPKRKGSTGNGFWRSRETGDETRYQWFVSSQREPFVDGSGKAVCELVYVDDALKEVRYCGASTGESGARR